MGKITDTGRMVVKDSKTGETAVNLDLELVLGELPKKTFVDHHVPTVLKLPLSDVAVPVQSPFSTTGCATVLNE